MSMSILTDYLGRMRMVPVLLFDEVNGEMGALGHFLGVFDLSQIIKDKQIVNFIIKILSL